MVMFIKFCRYTGALAIRTVDIRLDKKELQTFSAPPLTHFVNPLADSYRGILYTPCTLSCPAFIHCHAVTGCSCIILPSYSAGTREPVNVRDFADHVRNLHANDDFYFSEEYAVSHISDGILICTAIHIIVL